MTLNECIGRVCAYYKQDIKSVQAIEFANWSDKHVENFDEFYNMIIRNFEPSLTVPFPTLSHCEKIWPKRPQKYVPDYKLDLPAIEDVRISGIPDKKIDISKLKFDDVIDDWRNLKDGKFIHKYGYKVMYQFMRVITAWCDDNNFDSMVRSGNGMKYVEPVGGYSTLMLKKYYNVFIGG